MSGPAEEIGRIACERIGAIGIVTIDNPAKHNALTVSMWRALREAVVTLGRDEQCRCMILRGAGSTAFAAGADISEFKDERSNREQVTRYNEEYVFPTITAILDCPVPTIAMIAGVCMGGGLEIASVCDIRVAAENAKFGVPTQRMGFPLGFGETELVFKLLGRGVAMELLIASKVYAAPEALRVGIVQRVETEADLEDKVRALAEQIAAFSPAAVREVKAQLGRLLRDWSPVTAAERRNSYAFADSSDYQEGYNAFLKKTKPAFKGK